MNMKSMACSVGLALACALVVSFFSTRLAIGMFFGTSASMITHDVLQTRRRKKYEAILSRNEASLTQTLSIIKTSLAQAQAARDSHWVSSASSALTSTQELLSEVRILRASLS